MRLHRVIGNALLFLSFFSFNGYNAGIALVINYFGKDASRLFSVPLRLLTTFLMLLLVVHGIKNISKRNRPLYVLFVLFWSLYFVKIILTDFEKDLYMPIQEYFLYSMNFSILPFLTFSFYGSRYHLTKILKGILFGGITLGIVSVLLYGNYLLMGVGRLSDLKYLDIESQTLNPLILSYAAVLLISIALLCFQYRRYFRIKTIYLLCAIVLSVFMFSLGASRGSVIGLVFVLMYYVFHRSPRGFSLRPIMQVILLVMGIVLTAVYSESVVFDRLFATSEGIEKGASDSSRLDLWLEAYNEFKDSPFFGGRIEVGDYYPHNVFIEVLMSTGIVGWAVFLLVLISISVRGYFILRINQRYRFVFAAFLVGLSMSMFTNAVYNSTLLFMPLGLLLSLLNFSEYE